VTGSTSSNHYWDSCVLIRYLFENPPELVPDIAKFLDEAKSGLRRIYMSTMVIAEIKPYQLQQKGFQDFQELYDDMQAALHLIGPTPPILMQAARLQNYVYHRTPKQHDEKNRVLGGMDAIHLATCLHLRDVRGVTDIDFHTFDDGGGNTKPKNVSLLGFELYAQHINDPDVKAVCNLARMLPQHPTPGLV
jgi:predicted nucleic acid-binding protein